MHAGEGVDACAHAEIPRMKELGMLSPRPCWYTRWPPTPEDLKAIRESGTSIVWCPSSNLFTLGRTLGFDALQSGARLALGTGFRDYRRGRSDR